MMKLTIERIMQMQAGPAMNAAVAEVVMGWQRAPYMMPGGDEGKGRFVYCPPGRVHISTIQPVPDYSGDIACAFKMQAEIARRDLWEEYVRQLVLLVTDAEHAAKTIWYADENDWWAIANASPLARCKAALLVLAGRQEG